MFLGRVRLTGLLILLLASAACTSPDAEPDSRASSRDAAVASYTPPTGAPGFCSTLAAGSELSGLSDAMGVLAVAPSDVGARVSLGAAITELRSVLREMRSQGAPVHVQTAFEHLVSALQEAADGTVTDTVRTAVVTGLDDVGRGVQPICGFPT